MATLELNVVSNASTVLPSIDRRLDATSDKAEKLKKQFSSINFNTPNNSYSNIKIPDYSKSVNLLRSALPDIIKMVSSMYVYFTEVNSKFEQMNILLTTATGSSDKGREAFQQMIDLSAKAPFSIDALTDTFVKLRSTGIEQAYDYTVRLSDAIAAFGGNSEKLRLATVAVMQMAGKGVLSMEELKRQFGEQVPTALRLLEIELKRTGKIAQDMLISEAISKKLVGSKDGVEALMEALSRYSGTGAKVMDSYRGSLQLLSNQFQLLMYDIGESNGSFKSISAAIRAAADMIRKFRESAEGAAVIEKIARGIADGFNKITENPEIVYSFFSTVSSMAETAASSLKNMVLALNYVAYAVDNISGKTSSRSLTLLPENFNMEQYSKVAPLLKEYTQLESKLGDQSKISEFLFNSKYYTNSNSSLLDVLMGKNGESDELNKNKQRMNELTEAIKSGGASISSYTAKKKEDVAATNEEYEAIGGLVNAIGKNTAAEKEHQETIEYYQSKREKAYDKYQEALSGAQNKEEEIRVLKKHKEIVDEINQEESNKSRTAANNAEKDSLRELSAYVKNYTKDAREVVGVLREWNSETSSIIRDFNSMNDQLATATMGEFERDVYESEKALKENNKTIEEFQEKLAEANIELDLASTKYYEVTRQIEEMKGSLSGNRAGSEIQDINKLMDLVNLQEDLKKQVEETTKSYFDLYEANDRDVTSKQENARKIADNLKLSAYYSAASEIGIASDDMYNRMLSGIDKEKENFIKATGDKAMAEEMFSKRIIDLNNQRNEYVAKSAGNFTALLTAKFSEYYDNIKLDTVDFYENVFPNAIDGASDAMAKFSRDVMQGNATAADAWRALGDTVSNVIYDIIQEMIKLQTKAAIMGIGQSLFPSLFSAPSGSGVSGGAFTDSSNMTSWFGSAKGNIFSGSPDLSSYSNSIVSKPTFFARGGNVMGEAGPEAIMPLTRSSDGYLGVRSTSAPVTINVNNNASGVQASANVTSDGNGGKNIEIVIDEIVAGQIDRIGSKSNKALQRRGATNPLIRR